MLINDVVKRAIGSRSSASNAGRIHGSNLRSTCNRKVKVSLIQFNSAEPVLAAGMGLLTFELKSCMDQSHPIMMYLLPIRPKTGALVLRLQFYRKVEEIIRIRRYQ